MIGHFQTSTVYGLITVYNVMAVVTTGNDPERYRGLIWPFYADPDGLLLSWV